MRIRWLGHSAFEITTDENLKILIDPFIKDNPACPVEVEDLKPDIICITHGHKDHFGDAVALSERNKALIIANHEHSVYLSQQDLETVGMNIGGTIYSHEISITMINSHHSSDMDFTEGITSGGSACGYILELENHKKIYHSGDTGVFGDMKTVIRDIYRPDIAMIPIGDRYTMGPMEAAIAARWIEPQILIPMHYNTFPVIQQNPMEFKKTVELSNTNIKVVVLEPGQIYEE